MLLRNFFLFLLVCCATTAAAQLTPAEAVAAMGRGINLGNTLEPPRESAWNNGPAQESYFDRYVEAGFTNVRIPVRWDEHTADTPPYAVDASWMDRVEQVVDWGLDRGLYITLNGHHEDWLKNGYSNANLRDRYDAIWRQIIARFKNKSDKLLYEMINEPKGMTVAQVDDLNARLLGIIRAEEPTRLVIYGGNVYSNAEQLYDAAIPDDDYIIGYFHSYDPWPFAGEANRDWGTAADYQAMTNKLTTAANWGAANNIALHVSEFGAIHENDYNSRMRYYAHYTELCVTLGMAFSVWDDGGMFGILNRGAGTWPEEKDILINTYQDSPNRITAVVEREAETDAPLILVSWNNRVTGNDSLRVQRQLGNEFLEIARLAPDASSFLDADVMNGRSYTYRVITARADGTPLHSYPVRVLINSTVQSSFLAEPMTIPGVILTRDYDLGGEGLAYHDNEASNIPGGYRPDEAVDLEPNGRGGFHVGYVNQGEWIEYTVNVTTAGTYEVTAEIASEQSNGAWEISFESGASARMAGIPATGGWTTHEEMTFGSTVDLPAGEQVLRISITGTQPFNIDFLTFTLESNATEEEAISAGFLIAPNPVADQLSVQLPTSSLTSSTGRLQLYSSTGALLKTFPVSADTMRINLDFAPAGTYFLRFADGEKSLIRRLVVR